MNNPFLPGLANTQFQFKLEELLTVIGPIAKSTTCLESSYSTISDVLTFWLSPLAEIHAFVVDPNNALENSFKEQIRRAANFRFKQMFGGSDLYLTGLVLDPRAYSFSRNVHFLTYLRSRVPWQNHSARSQSTCNSKDQNSTERG